MARDCQTNHQEIAMSKKSEMVLKIAAGAILPALWAASVGTAAAQAPAAGAPRTFNSTVTHTGPAGNTVTRRSSLTTNGQGGFKSNSTWTGPKGNTVTSQRSGQYDAATKTYTSSGTLAGANGKQATFNTTVQGNGNGGYTRNSTLTGPNGNTVSTTAQGQYNAATGTFNQSRTTAYPNGQTSSESRSVSAAPAAAQPPSN
jgi:hypothetical protein